MLNSLWILSLGLFLLGSCSNLPLTKSQALKQNKVPHPVIEAFYYRHPDVSAYFDTHEFKKTKIYEVRFVVGKKDHLESFTKSGELISTEEESNFSAMDEAIAKEIKEILKAHDPRHKVLSLGKVSSKIFNGYEIKVKTKKSQTGIMEYYFNLDGSFHYKEELELEAIETLN